MPRQYRVAVLPGEGIGPEVIAASVQVLQCLSQLESFDLKLNYGLIGNDAYQKYGSFFPEETALMCQDSDGILFGSVEKGGLLELRKRFDLFCNLRPVRTIDELQSRSCLRPDRMVGIDILFVRELVSGIYFGEAGRDSDSGGEFGFHTMKYYDKDIRRIAQVALRKAAERRQVLTVAHKENALPHLPWTQLVQQESLNFPSVTVNSMLVDNLAMQLLLNPAQFDVVLAGNLFGDILSDIGGALVGSIGLLSSASLDSRGFGLYEAIHGTAPHIAGKGIANPIGTIGAVELMLRQWGLMRAADSLQWAQSQVISQGLRTADLQGSDRAAVGTEEIAAAIITCLKKKYAVFV